MPRCVETDGTQAIMGFVMRDHTCGELSVDVSTVDSAQLGCCTKASPSLKRRAQSNHRRYPGTGIVTIPLGHTRKLFEQESSHLDLRDDGALVCERLISDNPSA